MFTEYSKSGYYDQGAEILILCNDKFKWNCSHVAGGYYTGRYTRSRSVINLSYCQWGRVCSKVNHTNLLQDSHSRK